MRVPIPCLVAWTVARELVRALAAPLHVLAFLPRAGTWRARAREALATSARPAEPAFAAELAARFPARGGGVFVSCGEASGEAHAVQLVDAVERACRAAGREPPRWLAFGGERLSARGVPVRFPLAEHAVMGFVGVLRSAGVVCRAYATWLRVLRDERPDLVVLIDYPGLHLVMAAAARRRGIPVIHYVAPQYWAWGPWRMRRYRDAVDVSLTILPFEPAFFAAAGLTSAYVGHPLLDALAADPPDPGAVARVARTRTLTLLPGSRGHEIDHHLAPMVDVARLLCERHPDLRVVVPHRDPRRAAQVRAQLAELGADFVEVVEGDPGPWLRGARATLAKSGTGSLEACLHGSPTVVVYAVRGPLARFLLHRIVTVPFFASANLTMNRRIVPEFAVEHAAQWRGVATALDALLSDSAERSRCLDDLGQLRLRLGTPGASERVAAWIVPFCPTRAS